MLKRILHARVRRFEAELGQDMAYAHELLDISGGAFRRFARIFGMVSYRKDVPLAAYHAARIATTLAEDCGPCTQLVVTMAEREGVPAPELRAIVAGDTSSMGDEAALGWRYAVAVVAHDPEVDGLRGEVRRRWGDQAVASLALAMAGSRVFPTLKYALGHGQACARLRIGDGDIVPHRPGFPPAAA